MSQNTWYRIILVLVIIVLLSSFITPTNQSMTSAAPMAGLTERVSVSSTGEQGNNSSEYPSISADGRYVAFGSRASNLVSGDTNEKRDVFVHDQQTGDTTRISIASDGTQANGDSSYFVFSDPSISVGGRYVAFGSIANNLVSGDTNGIVDIFVHDRQTGETSRVSVTSDGTQGNNDSTLPSISADGRFVAFQSIALNLVSGNNNPYMDIFIHDRHTGETRRISVSSNGIEGNKASGHPSISEDGCLVAFDSNATNLVSEDTNGSGDIFVYNCTTEETTRVSVGTGGVQGNDWSSFPSISGSGRYVAFYSYSNNLVSGDTNEKSDVFVHDRLTRETIRISVDSDGTQGNDDSFFSSISTDGRYVAFGSLASSLVSGDTNNAKDVFVRNVQTGETSRVSIASDGAQGDEDSNHPSISADGHYIAFDSFASNLISGDTNGIWDIFVRDRCTDGSCAENPCDLDSLPLYYQGWPSTPDSLPNKPDWYDDIYGNYEESEIDKTVGKLGCNTTSNAIILDFYDQCHYSNNRTDPGVLNSWLREWGGYNSNHFVIYSEVIQYAKTLGIGMTISIRGRNDQKMNQHLDAGNPAMVKVQTSYGTHFVTVKGRTQVNNTETYEIHDPIWGDTTLYEHYNNTYSEAYYYTGSTSISNLSHLQISGLSPIHLLVTDPSGRKSGYDPRTDTTWDEISNAGYATEDIAEPNGGVLQETKILLITHPMEGEYIIEVIGYDPGNYEVEVVKLNHFGDSSQEGFSGIASDGSSDTFAIKYDPGSMIFLPVILK